MIHIIRIRQRNCWRNCKAGYERIMRIQSSYIVVILLFFLCGSMCPAQEVAMPEHVFREKLDEAVRLHDRRKFALADARYKDLLVSLMNRQSDLPSELLGDYILNYIDNCLSVNDFPMAVRLLETPVGYSPTHRIEHALLLSKTVRNAMPERYPEMQEWLDFADSTLLYLKKSGIGLPDGLELRLLNEKGNFYGTVDMADSLHSVIDRIRDIDLGRIPQNRDWPSDAFYWYALEIAGKGDVGRAVSILEDVMDHKVSYEIKDVCSGMIVMGMFAGISGHKELVRENMEKVLAAIDNEMSFQALSMPKDMFYLYFPENRFVDAMTFTASVTAPECNGVCYDALLTIRNLRDGVWKDLLAFSAENPENDFARMWRTAREIGSSDISLAVDKLVVEAADDEIFSLCRSHRKSWKDVRNALKPGEAAVEFIQVPDREPYYAALVLRRNSDAPAFVKLCPVAALKAELRKGLDIYRNGATEAYRLIWSPLEDYMRGIRTVYYSPAGDLYAVNMDAIMTVDGRHILSECFNLNMVSSTASILDSRPEPDYGGRYSSIRLLAYGGLDYYPDNDLWYEATWWGRSFSKDAPRFMFDRSDYRVEELMSDMPADSVRAGLDFLEHSLEEVKGIAAFFPHFNCFLKTGLDGTEEDFRLGCHVEIMHFATHSFYFDEDEVCQDDRLAGSDFSYISTAESSALKRCGLLFSGAGNTVTGKKPDGVFDGLVFGEDIAGRDFSNTDLVVLSACSTGLGDLRPDGVYGLQLAFKRAGVRTVMMSLWDVNDRSTALMMTSFYRYLMSGDDKRKALSKAREDVRKEYPDPYYWAPFVMID